MDPLTLVVAAVAAGAVAGLQDAASTAVKDAYAALKRLITGAYDDVDVDRVEQRPDSATRQAGLRAELEASGAADDRALRAAAEHLLDLIERHDPQAAAAAGVDLSRIRGAGLTVADVDAVGAGVRVHDADFTSDISITGVRAREPKRPRKR